METLVIVVEGNSDAARVALAAATEAVTSAVQMPIYRAYVHGEPNSRTSDEECK